MTATSFEWKDQRRHQQSLYPGQREALTRRHDGATHEQIAAAMGINRQTVTSYLGGAKIALGVASIAEACGKAAEAGLIPFYRPAGTNR